MNQILDGIRLEPNDLCYYLGEYHSGGTYEAGGTNQFISNFKADLVQRPQRAYYKNRAIDDAVRQFTAVISSSAIGSLTFVPMPGSKPVGHVGYDDRMIRVVGGLARRFGSAFDGRPVLITRQERAAQHQGGTGAHRATVDDLAASMTLDPAYLNVPLRGEVILVDDVFTLGTSFKAAQRLLMQRPEVTRVSGLYLARTIWPEQPDDVDISEFLASL
jgi:hypothetical protein